MRTILAIISFFVLVSGLRALPPDNLREFEILAGQTLHQLDSLSIMPESFSIRGPDGLPLDEAFYQIDYVSARLQLRVPEFWKEDMLQVRFRVWPLQLAAPVFARDTSLIRLPGPGEDRLVVPVEPAFPEHGLLRFEGLQSSGSITRGLTLGNRQDPVLSSAMNLQLSGRLTDDIDIVAVISDQNIPFQPDGTTQQLQDFDKVFIRLDGFGASLTAGDFELEKPPGYFLNLARKARGAKISFATEENDTTILGGGRLTTTAAGAISRGKYARNQIQGQEGNQGPYRLTGNENESFILVLAGTERVFLDGRPLQRGMDRDYIIDYNTAEITFMASVMITRESRIVAEFEYAERNYARSMVFTGAELEYEKASFRLNFFSEQDHRNQSLFQEVTEERRALMAAVGDSIHRAFDWNYDSTGFFNDRVMYRLTDTLGFDTVFVYSTDPEKAVYQLGFSFVGEGNGNYRQVSTSANGRVYEWMQPLNGVPQGTHEPIIQLITPKNHQMLTLGGDVKITPHSKASFEYALSNRDINLFSDLHKDNNVGHALRLELNDKRPARAGQTEGWTLANTLTWEMADQNFRPLERYRDVEFERDWNIEPGWSAEQEYLPGYSFRAEHRKMGMAGYSFRAYLRGEQYRGFLNSIDSRLRLGRNHLEYYGSLLNSSGFRDTDFYRHRTRYVRDLQILRAGVEHQTENNRIYAQSADTLSGVSRQFSQWEFFIAQADTAVNQYRLFYRVRDDGLPVGDNFENAAQARDYGIQYQYLRNPNQRIGAQLTYRELEVMRQRTTGEQSDKSLNARVDYFSRWGNGLVTSNIFYETSSGRERKLEYMYVEVPAGQGVYVWNDYNENGIMELDEFEISPYPEEANFIRVFIPTDEFVPVYSTAISHSLNLDPAALWREEEGVLKLLSRFSNRLNYRIDNKKQGGLQPENFNPFLSDVDDSLLISLSAMVRNSMFFNRTHPVYSIEWTFQDNRNKNLLSNGFESRVIRSNALRPRWNISRRVSLHGQGELGEKRNESEFFLQRNYRIRYYLLEPSVILQPAGNIRFNFSYGYQEQENRDGEELAATHKLAVENRLSFPARGTVQWRYQLSFIDFPHDPNTPVAFEMLQGLRQGTNHIWNINWQHNLSAYLQLSFRYNGRKPPDVPAIHTGTVQLRAMF
ncbi:MAG: hypothetical protein EA361_16345 [Bacteroidetes bacterium]|nr:MAG: hypothetical protein EA361_16345 [Bacteroidota bacterium]